MKKYNFVVILVLVLFSVGCKKDIDDPLPQGQGYRLVSKSYQNANNNFFDFEEFEYFGSRISRHIKTTYENDVEITEYTYEEGIIKSYLTKFESNALQDSTIFHYLFTEDNLIRILRWTKQDTVWIGPSEIEFNYEGDRVVSYNDVLLPDSQLNRGFYSYQGDQIIDYRSETFSPYIPDNWAVHFRKKFEYTNQLLTYQETINGNADVRYYYHYESVRLVSRDAHYQDQVNWIHQHTNQYTYDTNGSLILDKGFNAPPYNELLYTIEYKYEKGESNMDNILYHGYQYPGLPYPRL